MLCGGDHISAVFHSRRVVQVQLGHGAGLRVVLELVLRGLHGAEDLVTGSCRPALGILLDDKLDNDEHAEGHFGTTGLRGRDRCNTDAIILLRLGTECCRNHVANHRT